MFRGVAKDTFTSVDIIDGGEGNDTVKAVETANDQIIKPFMTSVETVEIALTSVDGKDITYDFGDAADVTSIKFTAADTTADNTELTVKGVATSDLVDFATSYAGNNTLTSATVTFDSVSGESDSARVNIGGNITAVNVDKIENLTLGMTAYAGTVNANAAKTITLIAGSDSTKTSTPADIAQAAAVLETLNIQGSGETLDLDAADIDFKGDAVVNITSTGKTIVAIDNLAAASNSLTVTGGAGKDFVDIDQVAQGTIVVNTGDGDDQVTIDGGDVTVNTGAGNDTLVVGANLSKITAKDSIDLGTGDDTVSTADATLDSSDKTGLALISGVEVLASSATALVTIDASALTQVNKFSVTGAMATGFNGTAATAGTNSVTLTSENDDIFTISAARVGQTAGKNLASTADVGKNGGDGINIAVKVDNGSNVANLVFVGNADVTGGRNIKKLTHTD